MYYKFWLLHRTDALSGGRGWNKFFSILGKFTLPILSAAAFAWFLIRVIPKPIRATYPCQQAAFPLATSFIIWLLGVKTGILGWLHQRNILPRLKIILIISIALSCVVLAGLYANEVIRFASNIFSPKYAWTPYDSPNSPIGEGKGIFPGRVVWTHNTNATKWNGSANYWWSDQFTDQQIVDEMLSLSLKNLTGKLSDAEAWDAIFRYHNKLKNRGDIGYTSGETVAIKINMNNLSSDSKTSNSSDATPAMVLSTVRQLVYNAGVPATNIVIYDARRRIGDFIVQKITNEFTGVIFVQETVGNTWGNREPANWVVNAFSYSHPNLTDSNARAIPLRIINATYLINLALLKQHANGNYNYGPDGQTAITVCGKNHFGSIRNTSALHNYIRPAMGMYSYNPIVDLMGTRHLGGKTILFIIDGLYGGTRYDSPPVRFNGAPFYGHWPSCLLASQDPVAIDSVAHDILNAYSPYNLWTNADNYLHEAALANNPPSGTVYQPDGIRLSSLGVHEHWNNSIEWKYSRNLGRTNGIELIKVESAIRPSVSIVQPDSDVKLPKGATVTISADASSTNGRILKVDFYSGSVLLGSATNSPYSITLTNLTFGVLQVRAVAMDELFLTSTSAVVNIYVQPKIDAGFALSRNSISLRFNPEGYRSSVWVSQNLRTWTLWTNIPPLNSNVEIFAPIVPSRPAQYFRLKVE